MWLVKWTSRDGAYREDSFPTRDDAAVFSAQVKTARGIVNGVAES